MAITVTATASGGFGGLALRVYVLTGAAATQNGATAVQSAAAAHNASITTTVTGSQVYGACLNGTNASPTVFSAATTLIDAIGDATHNKDYATCKATSATGTPGPTTLGFTDSNNGGIALYEVLPAGTITQDASSPAVVSTTAVLTLTTASFTPPAGAVLVALIASNGPTNGVQTMTVSDTSGLTWTPQAEANASNMKYAGVFTALSPSAATGSVTGLAVQAAGASLTGSSDAAAAATLTTTAALTAAASLASTATASPVTGVSGAASVTAAASIAPAALLTTGSVITATTRTTSGAALTAAGMVTSTGSALTPQPGLRTYSRAPAGRRSVSREPVAVRTTSRSPVLAGTASAF